MRRSAAPSLASKAKRPKFVTPFKCQSSTVNFDAASGIETDKLPACTEKTASGIKTNMSNEPCRTTTSQSVSQKEPGPASDTDALQQINPCETQDKENTLSNSAINYYSVMWCKNSKKKHKKWEGDAVLITESRTATLKDTEGKELSRSTGYKCSDLSSLVEGSTLIIGSKEIEVMQVLSAEDYKTGKCFITGITTQCSNPVKAKSKIAPKPFILRKADPNGPEHFIQKRESLMVQPRHDPMASGALVMPCPSHAHQWESNKQGMSVVDVVVDPRLSQQLRSHQRDGVVCLYECVMGMRAFSGQGAILADEMGLGKTLQCITLLWTLIKQGAYGGRPVVKKAIIITPSSLVKNWQQEFRKWLGSEKLQVFAVSSDRRAEEFRHCLSPVMIISYEMFLRCHEKIQDIRFDIVICDEGHRLKNTCRKTTSAIMGLPTRRRIILTGTPIQNDLQEFFAIVDFCNPGILGTAAAFRKVYEEPIVASRQPSCSAEERELGECRATELTRLTSLFCLRRTHEVIQQYLPAKVENVVFCRPTAVQFSLYQRLLDSRLVKSCLSGWSTRSEDGSRHLVCIGALKKLCNSPRLLYDHIISKRDSDTNELSLYNDLQDVVAHFQSDETTVDVEESGKLQVVVQMLRSLRERKNERVVLVSNYTKTLDLLQKVCERFDYLFLRLDGSTPSNKRLSLVDQFNKHGHHFVFLLSSKAGGVGLNIVGASHLVLYDIDWNPANDLQAMARVWRDGQKSTVHIYRLLTTGTIEEKMFQRQLVKQGLSGTVVDSKASGAKPQFSVEELKDLFTLREKTLCDTYDLICAQFPTGEDAQAHSISASTARRPCQLSVSAPSSLNRTNTPVAELLDWRYFGCPLDESELQDKLLLSSGTNITFVFQNTYGNVANGDSSPCV